MACSRAEAREQPSPKTMPMFTADQFLPIGYSQYSHDDTSRSERIVAEVEIGLRGMAGVRTLLGLVR